MFSNQNLQSQEAASKGTIEELQQEYESRIGELEKSLENATISKEDSDAYIEELLEELNSLKEHTAELETENEKLAALMEQEGQYLVLQLTGGLATTRILESTYEGSTQRIAFQNEEWEILAAELETILSEYLGNSSRLSVLFLYEGNNSYAKDVSAVNTTLEKIQKEHYFVYTKMNLAR